MLLRLKFLITVVILVTVLDTAHIAVGQTLAPDSSLQQILNTLTGTKISISQSLQYAMKNSTSIRRAEAIYLAASGSLRRERGSFDPEFYFSLNYQDMKEPTASFFAGAQVLVTQQTTSETGMRLNLPIGTELGFSLNTVRLKTNSQFAFLNPEYTAFGSLSFRQPLLGGFTSSGRKELTQAELEFDAAKVRYDQVVLVVSAEVEKRYWQLYSAARDYGVQKLIRSRAEAFLEEIQLKAKAGLVGPNQVASAKTFLAEQELLLIDRTQEFDDQSDQLAALIGVRPENDLQRFIAGDEPPTNFPVKPVDAVLEYALKNNFELQAIQKEIDAANELVDAANWESLPRLDLIGSLSSSAIGGNSQNVIFGNDTLRSSSGGNFGNVLSDVFSRKFPGWSVGLELSLPIGLRSGLGEKDRLEAQSMNVKQQYIELSRALEQQIRSAHRELSYGNDRLKAAMGGVEAASEQVRIGMIEFQNGRITAFELVRLREDFSLAQRRYSEALVRTVSAVATLRQLTSGKYPATTQF